jgi:hypothetical protein
MSSLRNRAETGGEIPHVTRHASHVTDDNSEVKRRRILREYGLEKRARKGLFLPTMEAYNLDIIKLQTLALTSDTKASCLPLAFESRLTSKSR